MFRNLMITSIILALVCIIIQNFATEGGMSVSGEINGRIYGFVTSIIEKGSVSGILEYFYSSMRMNFSMIILSLIASITMTFTIIIKSNSVIVGCGIASIMITVMFGAIIPVEYQRMNPIFMLMELCGQPPDNNTILLLSGIAIVELIAINTINCIIFKSEDIN